MTPPSPPARRPARLLLVLAVALGLVAAACGGDDGDDQLRGIQRTPAPEVGETSLPDVSEGGEEMPFRADEGEVLLAYFGYTHCPDVCPTTLADVRTALEDLGDDADRVELAMATIDPERDTGEVLTPYVRSFVPDAHALRTTDDAQLQQAADLFGVTYDVATDDAGEVQVTHSGFLYAVDDQGRLLVSWAFGTPAEDIAHDLELLLDQQAGPE
ncbi:SCO family protein [Iamia majanohamensis]|uniref:SCO family protein n=1 Tax=Iamia majanohamensis TaxID=467976 RepID=A0AAF0BRY6_9ACTN|nr:SCO family protein [Iamia majanohamensis]WCO67431.1 SCO family protein [Iamia majanohamensis]